MSLIFYYFFMAVGLSMDAFSLAIVYGTNDLKKKMIIILAVTVGLFHFIMPNLSKLFSIMFLKNFTIYSNIVAGVVFLILGLEMLFSFKEKDTKYELNSYFEVILFSIAVSIDSFSVGLALSLDNQNIIIAGLIFSITSFIFTLLGLLLGKLLSNKIGNISKVIGIIILFIFAGKYLLGN